ncbi:IS1380 family transposase [Acetoanaerobium noterae]|uniref:IS1380 family transposase n=1 Tax=Acetoanaerobium noterae TaxID=745369 RepID=UPI0028B16EEA|nr:IS1380 family transposase [Acetoanaerobium noterae]
MINKIEFKAKNLTSNAGLFLMLENTKNNGIFEMIENDLTFESASVNKIKMNQVKTMLSGHFIGIDKLERLKLLKNDPLVREFDISVKEPETVSRFLSNFSFKTTQMFREINFKVFKKLLSKSGLTSITIDIDSSVINVEGHQEGATKGYNPKKLGNRCYNVQFAFCDELKAYVTGFVRSGNAYTANGAAELIKEIVATLKAQNLEIFFRMDSGYFDEEIIETIESLGCKYLIKAKAYATLVSQVTASSAVFLKGIDGRETAELLIKLDKWKKKRRFVVSRVLKPEKERAQLSLLEGSEYDYFFFVTNTDLESEAVVLSYEKRGNAENYIKEAKYDMSVGHLLLKSFWANEAVFQMMMLSYNLFLLFKFDYLDVSEYRQQIKTFRLKYVFLAAKIIKTARSVIMKLSSKYPYQEVYKKCICLES